MDEKPIDPSDAPDSTPAPAQDARRRLILPLAVLTGALALFLILFWNGAEGRRHGHGRHGSHGGEGREAMAGDRADGNGTASGSGSWQSPVGGGSRRPAARAKGETWWYREGEPKPTGKAASQGWWAPRKGGTKSDAAPATGNDEDRGAGKARSGTGDRPAVPSPMNPGEAAGQTGPDDFWWRK